MGPAGPGRAGGGPAVAGGADPQRGGRGAGRAAGAASSELDLQGLRLAAGRRRPGRRGAGGRERWARPGGPSTGRPPTWSRPGRRGCWRPWSRPSGTSTAGMAEARRDVGTAADVLDLAGPMLGRDGPRRWFLAVVTPAENRGSGGLVGNIGEITATGGKLDLAAVERVARLNEAVDDAAAARVLPQVYADAYERLEGSRQAPERHRGRRLPHRRRSPGGGPAARRPRTRWTAPSASTRWPSPRCSTWSGPVSVPSWPVPISAGNAASVLLHEQYVALDERRPGELPRRGHRRRSGRGPPAATSPPRPRSPGRWAPPCGADTSSSTAAGPRSRPRSAVSAPTERCAAPVATTWALVTDNASESKVDWFLRRAVDYRAPLRPGLRIGRGHGQGDPHQRRAAVGAAGLRARRPGRTAGPQPPDRAALHAARSRGRPPSTAGRRPPAPPLPGPPGNWAHELDVTVPPSRRSRSSSAWPGRLAPCERALDARRRAASPPSARMTSPSRSTWPTGGASSPRPAGSPAGDGRPLPGSNWTEMCNFGAKSIRK